MPRSITITQILLLALAVCCCFCSNALGQASQIGPEIKPPKLENKTTRIKFPATVDDVVIGGAGRYLLYQFRSLRKIGVFDVNVAKITHFISTPDTESKIAAGLTKLVIVTGDGATVSRYDIASGKRELTAPLDLSAPPAHVLLGNASEGPIIVSGGDRSRDSNSEIDLKSLKFSPMKIKGNQGFRRSPRKISANGKTLTCWGGGSPSGLQTILRVGNEWEGYYEHTSVGAILPSADGKTLFTAGRMFTNRLAPFGSSKRARSSEGTYPIPAAHGLFYLGVSAPKRSRRRSDKKEKATHSVSLHMLGDDRPLAAIDLESAMEDGDQWGRSDLLLDQRYILLPKANLIVQLSGSRDEAILTQFDVVEALSKSEIDFLFVESQPPAEIPAGNGFEYQIKVQSKVGDLSYSLSSGPKGMKISKTGLMTWSTSKRSPPKNSVIVTVADKSGQEIFHVFDLKVQGGKGAEPDSRANAVFSEDADVSVKGSPVAKDEKEKLIKLPGTFGELIVAGGGRFVLVHFKGLKKIGVFDIAKAEFTKYLPATDDRTLIAAGANHVVVVSQDQGVMSRYNLTTFERELTKTVPFPGTISYVGMGNNSYGPVMVRWSATTGEIDSASFAFIALKTLEKFDVNWPKRHLHSVYRDVNHIRASSDGKVFSVRGIGPLKLSGSNVRFTQGQSRSFGSQSLVPSADGKFFVSGTQIYNDKLIPIGESKNRNRGGLIVPSVSGQYYLRLATNDRSRRDRDSVKKGSAKLYLFGDSRPIVNIPELTVPASEHGHYQVDAGKNLLFIPDAKVIVSASSTLDSLVLKRFDLEEALRESGIDYLVVTSSAPSKARLGQPYEYQMETLSKNGGVTYKLDAGPPGLTVSGQGKITWTPRKTLESAEQKVIVTVGDAAAQEAFHTFSIEIPEVREVAEARKKAAEEEKRRIAQEQKQAATKKRLAKMEVEAAKRRQAVFERTKNLSSDTAVSPGSDSKSRTTGKTYPVEAWTDATGKHTLSARFLNIEDESKVILQLENGTKKVVPLPKLKGKHVYRAVKYDLEKRGVINNGGPSTSESPFRDAGAGKNSSPNLPSDQTLGEIAKDVERMINVVKNEKDKVKLLRAIMHPPALTEMMERDSNLENFKREFDERQRLRILEGLLSINYSQTRVRPDGAVVTRSSSISILVKYEGTWYVAN